MEKLKGDQIVVFLSLLLTKSHSWLKKYFLSSLKSPSLKEKNMIKRLAFVGSRGWRDLRFVRNIVREQILKHGSDNVEIISGGARGPDKASIWEAECSGVPSNRRKEFLPKWTELGKKAGFVRNAEIVGYVGNQGEIFAFWNGTSHGTKHTIETAVNSGVKVTVFKQDGTVEVFHPGEQQEMPF